MPASRRASRNLEISMPTFLSDDLPPAEWNRRRSLQAAGGSDPNGGLDPNAPILRLHDGLPPAVWQKVRAQQLAGGPAAAATASPSPDGPRLGAQRPGVGPLLGLISHAEGTEADGYDTMFNNPGGRRSPPGGKKPTQMTVEEAIHGKADRVGLTGGSAIGKYQFLPKTLTQLKTWMGLHGDETMTPQLQDAMAEELLYQRGFDKYQAGKLSAADFQKQLAKEWRSLPADESIRARVGTEQVQDAIARSQASSGLLDEQLDGGYLPP
jgi:muramidase (phage lysozyme)